MCCNNIDVLEYDRMLLCESLVRSAPRMRLYSACMYIVYTKALYSTSTHVLKGVCRRGTEQDGFPADVDARVEEGSR